MASGKYMRITWVTFMMGWLAIIGIPPLSGFFSKDPIIEAAFNRPGWTGLALRTVPRCSAPA